MMEWKDEREQQQRSFFPSTLSFKFSSIRTKLELGDKGFQV
jgi:hypothetical protein